MKNLLSNLKSYFFQVKIWPNIIKRKKLDTTHPYCHALLYWCPTLSKLTKPYTCFIQVQSNKKQNLFLFCVLESQNTKDGDSRATNLPLPPAPQKTPTQKKLESCSHYTWFQSHTTNYKSKTLGQKIWDKVRSYWEHVDNPLRT